MKDPSSGKWKWQATGTADKSKAKHLQERKWDEVNGRVQSATSLPSASWDDCRDAFNRAMEAEYLRPSYILDSTITFDGLRKMFPEATIPAQITSAMAQEYKQRRHEAGRSSRTIKGDLATLKAVFGKWLVKRNNARKVGQRLLDQDRVTIRFPESCSARCAEG